MLSKKIKPIILVLLFYISLYQIFGFTSNNNKEVSNPLNAVSINSSHLINQNKKDYFKIYSSINNLILNNLPVLIKEDIDKYLDEVSQKITMRVVDNTKSEKDTNGNFKSGQTPEKDTEIPSISFDFPNVTLVEFSRFVASLNKKILIGDNLLQGNITIKTPKKLTLKRLMDVFQALLNSKGLSYMISGKYMQIYQKSDSEVKVYQINYLKAGDVAKTLQNIFKMSFNVGGHPERIMVNSLDDANCIVVLAPKSRQREVKEAIDSLDWRRRQVLLEVKVVELTYNNQFGFGITAGADYHGIKGGMGPGMTNFNNSGTKTSDFGPILPDISSPYTGFLYDNGQFLFDLKAEEKITKLKILTQPKLLTSENQKAEINVGHQEPVQQSQTNMGTSSSGIPATETTVAWKDIGVKVEITPRINATRDVTLDFKIISTSIIDHITVGSFSNYPVIGQRITSNTSTVMDGQSLVLGGLLKEEKKTQKYKFPFLGDIPGLGWLFTTIQEISSSTELIMFITPYVIETSEEGAAITKDAIKNIEDFDKSTKEQIEKGVKGERDKSWDIFNLYDYFNSDDYKENVQEFIPQSWKNPRD